VQKSEWREMRKFQKTSSSKRERHKFGSQARAIIPGNEQQQASSNAGVKDRAYIIK